MKNKKQKIILSLSLLILITVFLGIPGFYQDIAISIFSLLIIAILFCNSLGGNLYQEKIESEKDFVESKPQFEEKKEESELASETVSEEEKGDQKYLYQSSENDTISEEENN